MQKAIHIDGNGTFKRILSITDISAVEDSPNGLVYIPVEYVEQPEVEDTNRDIVYPMYNSETGVMFWQVINYQNAATDLMLDNQNLKIQVAQLNVSLAEKEAELIDTQLAVAELAELVAGGAE